MANRSAWVLAVVVAITSADDVEADAVLPRLFRDPPLHIRCHFENLKQYPELDFHVIDFRRAGVHYHRYMDAEATAHVIAPPRGEPGKIYLIAVPKGFDVLEHLELDNDQWRPLGMLQSQSLQGENGLLRKADNGYELHYRVGIAGGALTVELVNSIPPPPPSTDWGQLVCTSVCVSIPSVLAAWGIVVLIRRAGRRIGENMPRLKRLN